MLVTSSRMWLFGRTKGRKPEWRDFAMFLNSSIITRAEALLVQPKSSACDEALALSRCTSAVGILTLIVSCVLSLLLTAWSKGLRWKSKKKRPSAIVAQRIQKMASVVIGTTKELQRSGWRTSRGSDSKTEKRKERKKNRESGRA